MNICVFCPSSAPLHWDPPNQNRGEELGREGEAGKSWSKFPQLAREGLWSCWASQPGAAPARHRVGWAGRACRAARAG